ncbi:MAG: hypothetical protein WC346_04315 [Methanogenium sp.]|jgi:hypothetical protein
MGNEKTKKQIRDWLEQSVKEARNPDMRKIIKKKRELKKKEIAKNYGF